MYEFRIKILLNFIIGLNICIMAIIDSEYYRKQRHNCDWRYLGDERVETEGSYSNAFLSPTTIEIIVSDESAGSVMYANVFVTPKGYKYAEAFIKEDGQKKKISLFTPILLLSGQVLEIAQGNRSMDLRLCTEPIENTHLIGRSEEMS